MLEAGSLTWQPKKITWSAETFRLGRDPAQQEPTYKKELIQLHSPLRRSRSLQSNFATDDQARFI
jgi:hypothetical protein